ncbi:MAG TPA: hypothetical protein ENK57_19690 [Polyangiaceae bacterium]|nr:hypothetical protein [Polyangiaceae bacterium]
MRWVNGGLVLLMLMSSSAVGCTQAVMQAGADDPRAFAALPFALVGDLIAAGASGDSSSGGSSSAPHDPSLLSWEDPDDWVAECTGPTICRAPESFVCYGEPGDCHCACTMSIATTQGAAAAGSVQ